MNRLALLVLVLVALTARATGAEILILVPASAAGPRMDPRTYYHPIWVLWPAPTGGDGSNRLLSVMSGLDWQGSPSDTDFAPRGQGWISSGYRELAERGYTRALGENLRGSRPTLVRNPRGSSSPSALLLAVRPDSPEVATVGFRAPWPDSGLLAYEALGWDDAATAAKKAGGRALFVEYPPGPLGCSRVWLIGRGWPEGIPRSGAVPGLVEAKFLGSMLARPASLKWSPEQPTPDVPNRWLEAVRVSGPVETGVIICALLAAILWAVRVVCAERKSFGLATLLGFGMLYPAAAVAAGVMSRSLGLDGSVVWLCAAWLGLGIASLAALLPLRLLGPDGHPLAGVCVVGLLVLSLADCRWSLMSPELGWIPGAVSPPVLGAWFGYLVGLSAFAPRMVLGGAFAWLVAAVLTGWAIWGSPWWADSDWTLLLLPIVGLMVGEGVLRNRWIALLALLPTSVARAFANGLAWAPGGELAHLSDRSAVDASRYAQLVLSPSFAAAVIVAGALGIFGGTFLWHQLRSVARGDPRSAAPLWAGAAAACMGVSDPILLQATPILLGGGLSVLLFDALRTL